MNYSQSHTVTVQSYAHRSYTLSELAYKGLFSRLLPPSADEELPFNTDDGVVYHTTSTQTREGVSHALNTYAKLSLDVWIDTRPPSIVKSHEALQKYTGACRFPWYYQPLIPDPDDPPDLVPSVEEQLSLPQRRRPRTLSLTKEARYQYSHLARMYKMEPHSQRYNLGNYIAAALEAIGIGWLSLPSEYSLPPNPNKVRPGLNYSRGTDHLRAWEMTRDELERISKYGYGRVHQAEPDEGTEPES